MESLDPRVNRLDLEEGRTPTGPNEHWQTYEVFHQKKRGDQVIHVGIVHAASPEMALIFAKEQFARRQKCTNIWVVKTTASFDKAPCNVHVSHRPNKGSSPTALRFSFCGLIL